MRLLHTRHDHGRQAAARAQSQPHRTRDPGRTRGESLPLHRVRQRRQLEPGGAQGSGARGRPQGARAGLGEKREDFTMAISQMVGASIKRREDPRLVTGTGSYVDDISQTALVHMHVVRSSEAHARILGIETARAKEADGVLAILTGKDLKPEFGAPLPVTVCFVPDKKYPNHYPIAIDKVHYVGEPVAIVLASSRAAAEDAGERIEVKYQSLPAVVAIQNAIAAGAPGPPQGPGSKPSDDVKVAARGHEA